MEISRQILEKGGRIEQEFAEFFTGMFNDYRPTIILRHVCDNVPPPAAVVEGDSVEDIYTKAKNVIHEQSGSFIWVPSSENI